MILSLLTEPVTLVEFVFPTPIRNSVPVVVSGPHVAHFPTAAAADLFWGACDVREQKRRKKDDWGPVRA